MTIKTQIVALTTATGLVVALVLGGITAHLSTRLSDRSVAELEGTLWGDYDASIRREVETVISLLRAVEARVEKHDIEPARGMTLAADLVRSLRYGKDDYFWIDTYEGVNVVLLGREIEGHGRLDLTDEHGFQMVRRMIEVARAGGGFTDYWFPRGSGGAPLPKRSYSAAFKPFGWVQRAKDAAGRTEALIGESVREASEGEITARTTAEKLGQVVVAIGEVGDLVSAIAAAVREGVTGLDGVNEAVADLDEVTQQDAASAEESSAAAGELDGRAAELAALVAQFQLDRDADRAR